MTTPNTGNRRPTPGTAHADPDLHRHDADVPDRRTPNALGQVHAAQPSPSNLLLPRSPLIGREHEIAAVQRLLLQAEVGLLTLTGPGGIGKTRLAMQVAANLLDHFVDGVYFVSLAPISDPDLVCAAIVQTLGVREAPGRALSESLQAYLRDRQLLLVLDNFEQIVAAAPLVSALLAECRRLRVLVTSRATLRLYGEHEFPISPLGLPDPKRLTALAKDSAASLTAFAAIDLFCQRARAVKPDFALTPSNATDVAKICVGLDGLPLAIELAAARIKVFSPPALLARLQQRLTLLTGGPHDLPARQRTLRDEIAWSYDLLTASEQTLFRRLAVFVGGFTLEAAQAVGNAAGDLGVDVLDSIVTLVDQNLLKQVDQNGGASRFGLLETICEYGLEQLNAGGEAEMIRRYHADFFLSLVEAIEPELAGPQHHSTQGRARLTTELDNLRAVFAWSQTPSPQDEQHRAEVGLRLAGALSWFPFGGNHTHELRRWLVTALQRAEAPTAARAKALWGAGLTAIILGDYPIARTELEESVALWRTLGDQCQLAAALRELCRVAYAQRDLTAAQRYGEESVALYRTLERQPDLAIALENLGTTFAHQGDQATARTLFEEQLALAHLLDDASLRSGALVGLGWIARQQGDHATARAHFAQALAIRRALDESWMVGEALDLLGEVLQQQGELDEAGHHYRQGLTVAHEVGDKGGMVQIFYHLGTLALAQGQPAQAVRLLAFATALRSATGGAGYHAPTTAADWERAVATMQSGLGTERFARCWAEGQAMNLEEAIADALTTPDVPEDGCASQPGNLLVAAPATHSAGLTAREVEVLRLMAQGLSYAELADKLVISRRTVNAHVTSIFSKLDVTSRAAATRFALDHHLV
jgi:predicted ATPase/DNA-binding CsgD family transcriptional regulator/Flp pilus assembly protein TadD